MFKELSTMALVAVMTTNISQHFDTVLGAAKDIAGVYQVAATAKSPEEFIAKTKVKTARLTAISEKVAKMDVKKELGPFGVVLASNE